MQKRQLNPLFFPVELSLSSNREVCHDISDGPKSHRLFLIEDFSYEDLKWQPISVERGFSLINMEANMKKDFNITSLAFGVSFNHMFRLLDMWGEIADNILYGNKYFPPGFFPQISTQYTTERRLVDPEKNHQFVLASNNLLFSQTIETSFEKERNEFKNRVLEYIIPKILCKYGLIIRRLGIVYTCELNKQETDQLIAKFFNPEVKNIADFRFSKKEPTRNGEVLNGNQDFVNKIITVGNITGSTPGISYDYQYHFLPLREDVRDFCPVFFQDAYNAFKNDMIESFTESNYGEK